MKIIKDASVLTKRTDQVFAAWNQRNSPGCALAVIHDGKIVYERGYGMADLEHGVPITPSTVFHVASISKQFTAFAIHLLSQEGKLSLDDDVRKYLPELHDFGKTLTIRQLLHHTSGLRDQWDLMKLSGRRMDDVVTNQDVLDLVWRQKELNFDPGAQFLYCNSDYTLLGEIIKRISGHSLREFDQNIIFKPLGMNHTRFNDDYREMVKNRAYSYEPSPAGGYRNCILSFGTDGPTGLLTTVDDLALWDENFYDGRVGGKAVLASMQEKGKLNDGKEISYASGLDIGEYRGLKTVEHSGEDAGFRADILRFPDQRFTVIVLSNFRDFDEDNLPRRVADIYLEDRMKPMPSPKTPWSFKPSEVKINPQLLEAYVGDYELYPGFFLMITKENDHLMFQATGKDKFQMYPASDKDFFMKGPGARVTFNPPIEGGKSQSMIINDEGDDETAKRKARTILTPERLQEYAGAFYSEELGIFYVVSVRDGVLSLRYPRFDVAPMLATDPDTFALPSNYADQSVRFIRNGDNIITGLTISGGRAWNLRFMKSEINPVISKNR